MDWTNFARSMFTVLCFASFIVILLGAYGKKSKQRYEEAAMLPFMDDEYASGQAPERASNGAKQ
ncbi:cbb3-type cytochrome oxidase subunit 3 [Crenobacter intestini]|uniref:Cbb3-type cytochrome c oxidase subunit 3 n=1 Tax=Crenobacter intestini TaxID=2563443 RepID=A0A4T0UJD6_9NEIS|nr:cbb3-type cytochrome c oxidase subunit 3 [Crenobacter intestini]TIC78466.1 cbb3-type cytochrome c oxidase subunit 3 [Crenobacter intestini]